MSIPGGWNITENAKNLPACDLPEKVASTFTKVTKGLIGAKYEPLLYLATQIVDGENHMILCRETLSTFPQAIKISTLILHIPATGDPQIITVTQLF